MQSADISPNATSETASAHESSGVIACGMGMCSFVLLVVSLALLLLSAGLWLDLATWSGVAQEAGLTRRAAIGAALATFAGGVVFLRLSESYCRN